MHGEPPSNLLLTLSGRSARCVTLVNTEREESFCWKEMGNCLKSPTSDDISLLHESSYGDPDQEPPPPYEVISKQP